MNILTITCEMDINDIIRQARSLNMYNKGITHYIAPNDKENNIQLWENLLKPHYKNNKLVILDIDISHYTPLFYKFNGYDTQQLLKLLASEYIKDDYLVLDSKDIIIKELDKSFWMSLECNGKIIKLDSITDKMKVKCIENYCKYFGCIVPEFLYDNLVPFYINYNIIKERRNFKKDLKWFFRQKSKYEFLFYSMLILSKKEIKYNKNQLKSVYYYSSKKDETFTHDNDFVEILSVHRNFIRNMTENTRKNLNNFLLKRNLSIIIY